MNELTSAQSNRMSLMDAQKMYVSKIGDGLVDLIGNLDHYQTLCGYNILSAINTELAKKGLNHTSNGVDRESINNAIKFASIYGLNTDNREVFVIIRNEKRALNGKEYWCKKIECKPQYRGQLKILSTFGRDVKKVFPEWIVREGDEFKYPTYKGVEIVPPEWTPKSCDGKVVRVVVPIQFKDKRIEYRIAERESVATNIKAQIKQSLMSEDKEKSARILALIKDYTLEQLLDDKEVAPYVNDTYTGLSAEEMIITKLVLNATKRIAIDYKSALARELMENTYDNADVYKRTHNAEEIIANEQSPIELQGGIVPELTTQDAKPVADEDTGEIAPKKESSSLFEDLPF